MLDTGSLHLRFLSWLFAHYLFMLGQLWAGVNHAFAVGVFETSLTDLN